MRLYRVWTKYKYGNLFKKQKIVNFILEVIYTDSIENENRRKLSKSSFLEELEENLYK